MKRRLGGRVAMSSGWRWAGDDSFASWLARTHSERLSWGGFGERVREHARGRNNPQKKLPNSQLPELTEGEMQIRKIFLAAQSQELFSIYVRARKRERVKLGFSFCFSLLLLDSIAAASFFCLFFTSLTLFAFASLFYFSFFCDKCMNFFMRLVVVFFFISLQIHEKTALWVRRGRETTREGARVQALLPLPSLRLYICIWQNRSCSTAHIHVYMHSKRGGEQSLGHRKKIHGGVVARQRYGKRGEKWTRRETIRPTDWRDATSPCTRAEIGESDKATTGSSFVGVLLPQCLCET